jgi:Domain of unknown function (DUF1843)
METTGPIRPQPLYAPPIHRCIAKGDLGEMRGMVKQAEEYLRESGNISAALEALKAEIAKLEAKIKH